MIKFPNLTAKQAKDIKDMQKTNGYEILSRAISVQIDLKNAELINFLWKFDDSGEASKKSVHEFRDIQKETVLLKKLFAFLQDPVIIKEKTDGEIYEGYSKE